jgi:hypothetical protein
MQNQKRVDYVLFGIPGLCYFSTHIKTESLNKNSHKYPTTVAKSNEINAQR